MTLHFVLLDDVTWRITLSLSLSLLLVMRWPCIVVRNLIPIYILLLIIINVMKNIILQIFLCRYIWPWKLVIWRRLMSFASGTPLKVMSILWVS
jgi:hypothetical protein